MTGSSQPSLELEKHEFRCPSKFAEFARAPRYDLSIFILGLISRICLTICIMFLAFVMGQLEVKAFQTVGGSSSKWPIFHKVDHLLTMHEPRCADASQRILVHKANKVDAVTCLCVIACKCTWVVDLLVCMCLCMLVSLCACPCVMCTWRCLFCICGIDIFIIWHHGNSSFENWEA